MLIHDKTQQQNVPENFKEIFHTYYPVICRQAAYLLGTTEAVDDIAQEAFLRLYYSPPAEFTNVGGWLARVTANLCFNHLKREKSRKQREASSSVTETGKIIALEDIVMKNQEAKRVREILFELDERDRVALLLKFSGYRYEEIAQVIETEKSSVGTILARAQKKFKTLYLKREGGDPNVL